MNYSDRHSNDSKTPNGGPTLAPAENNQFSHEDVQLAREFLNKGGIVDPEQLAVIKRVLDAGIKLEISESGNPEYR